MPFLKKGKIFTHQHFENAVRRCQNSMDNRVKTGDKAVEYPRKRPKYQLEVQATAAQILFKTSKPESQEGLGDLHPDVLRISQIGIENYRSFFEKRISAVSTGSIKLRPAFITLKSGLDYDKLENQTKQTISEEIFEMIKSLEFENVQEKLYYENKAKKTAVRKEELLIIHIELTQMMKTSDEI
jgi:hypothetical protein